MHGKIIQLDIEPIEKSEYIERLCFLDNSIVYADYIGEEVTDESVQREILEDFVKELSPIFTLKISEKRDPEYSPFVLVFNGRKPYRTFLNEWAKKLKELTKDMSAKNILDGRLPLISGIANETHNLPLYRVTIGIDIDFSDPLYDLFTFIEQKKFRKGDCLYVGGMVDYHC